MSVLDLSTLKIINYKKAYQFEEKTLEDYNIVHHRTYAIEIKNDNEAFEEFNPDVIIINICLWRDEYIDLHDEKEFKFDKIKIDRKLPLTALKKMIYDMYNIDEGKSIHIFKKIDFALNNYQITDLMNKEEDFSKEIHNNMIVENSKLFLEIKDETWTTSHFVKFFEDNCTLITIKFNFPLPKEMVTVDPSKDSV